MRVAYQEVLLWDSQLKPCRMISCPKPAAGPELVAPPPCAPRVMGSPSIPAHSISIVCKHLARKPQGYNGSCYLGVWDSASQLSSGTH